MLSTDEQKTVGLSDTEREEQAQKLWAEKQQCIQRIAEINRELRNLGYHPHKV